MTEDWPFYSGEGWTIDKEMLDEYLASYKESDYKIELDKQSRGVLQKMEVRCSDLKPVYSMVFRLEVEEYSLVERQVFHCIYAHKQERERLTWK